MRKLRKNKFLVLTITVIVVSIVYFVAQKAIDNYAFDTNSDITIEEESVDNTNDEMSVAEDAEKDDKNSIEISKEETDFVLEEELASDESVNVGSEEAADTENESNNINVEIYAESKIYVYITGEVNNPGVITLDEGSRIVDAINAAGGTTAKANISKVNLVYILEDGMKVNIPNNSDLKDNPDFEYITMGSGDGGNDNETNFARESSGSTGSGGDGQSSRGGNKYSIVNINTATQTELETLPGIGPSLALNIINYRKENGMFSSIDEIKNVSGIGDSKFENLKSYITV